MAAIRRVCYCQAMGVAIPAKVFRHGQGRAVTIPAGLELPTGKVTIRQDGPRLVIEPVASEPNTLRELFASWDRLDEEFGPTEDLPPGPVNL